MVAFCRVLKGGNWGTPRICREHQGRLREITTPRNRILLGFVGMYILGMGPSRNRGKVSVGIQPERCQSILVPTEGGHTSNV